MKILHRYVLKEHAGPLGFALGALTALLFLNQVAKRFGDLAGKGLPWSVIGEFFALAIPFIVAMTLPMAVLVATLYGFSRLAAENEITALKASGVGMRRILAPVLWAAAVITLAMILFNDQVLPRTNHRLAVLQRDIAQKKPTFALREQVINELTPGKLYLRAGRIDENSNRMREIVIYDFADPGRRRTIYADSGNLALSENQSDLLMTLYDGTLQDVPTGRPEQLQRLFFRTDRIRVRGVGNEFQKTETGTFRGEREMTICEMANAHTTASEQYAQAAGEFRAGLAAARRGRVELSREILDTRAQPPPNRTLGTVYCAAITAVGRALTRLRGASVPPEAAALQAVPGRPGGGQPGPPGSAADGPAGSPVLPGIEGTADTGARLGREERSILIPNIEAARMRIVDGRRLMALYSVEIHKKMALAVACLIFVLLGAPIAVRFPRGGVGMVIGVSIGVFGLYYVALIGGQSLGVRGIVPPALAMWGANLLFGAIGLTLAARMGREGATARGGDMREMLDAMRTWTARRLTPLGIRMERRRRYG